MKKLILVFIFISPFYLFSQTDLTGFDSVVVRMDPIDTLGSGNTEVTDLAAGLKIVFPFRARKVHGLVEAFTLTDNRKIFSGNVEKNKRQGLWEFFTYDTAGVASLIRSFNYLDDSLSGEFFMIEDSIWTRGNFTGDSLNGPYRRDVFSISDSGDTVITPLDSGLYAHGLMYGEWVFFENGKLAKTGYYEEGKKHRHWKFYDTYNKDTTNIVMREINYFEGTKTGNEIKYFHYEFESCGEKEDSSCVDTVKVQEIEQIPWQNGKLSGTYYKNDENGNTLEKGIYSEDKKVGEWNYSDPLEKTAETKNYLNDVLNGEYVLKENGQTVITGIYASGKKDKVWTFRDEGGHKIREENYAQDVKDGEWKYYHSKGNLGLMKVFENGDLIEMTEYDKSEIETLVFSFETNDDKSLLIKCEELSKDSLLFIDFKYQPQGDKINDETFMETYKSQGKDTTIFKRNGDYLVKKEGQIEVKGSYTMNVQVGSWDYYYNPSIIWRKVYKSGLMAYDMFLDNATKAPLEKGDYVLWYGPERPKVEFKIKEGLRNGKSTYYKLDGEVLKVDKYKDGVLQ